ncbi:hypothetical protein [Bacillus spizizenii]
MHTETEEKLVTYEDMDGIQAQGLKTCSLEK